jgi:hypothetical protein
MQSSPQVLENFAEKLRSTFVNGDFTIGEWTEKDSDINVNTTLDVWIVPSQQRRTLLAHFWANCQASTTHGIERTVRSGSCISCNRIIH